MDIPIVLENNTEYQSLFGIPSIYYTYIAKNVEVPSFNNEGTDEERSESLDTWYSMGDIGIDINTIYAQTVVNGSDSILSLSLKNRIRQPADYAGHIRQAEFQILTFPCGLSSYNLEEDFYHYPCHPEVDVFKVAKMVIRYMDTLDFSEIYEHLNLHGITNITEEMCYITSTYNLFFLLTRFMGHPVTDFQINLSLIKRKSTNSMLYKFVNSVYHRETNFDDFDFDTALTLANMLAEESNESVMKQLDTPYESWTKVGYEYLYRMSVPEIDLNDPKLNIETLTQYFQSITDNEGLQIMKNAGLEPSDLDNFISRRIQKESFASWYKQKLDGSFERRIFKIAEH